MLNERVRKTALILAALLAFSVTFAGCSPAGGTGGSSPSAQTTQEPPKTYTIGYLKWGQGSYTLDLLQQEAEYISGIYGNTLTAVGDNFEAAQQLENVNDLISLGVNGIMLEAYPESGITEIAERCNTAGIPFVIYGHVPTEDVHDDLTSNQYYAGSVCVDGIADAAALADRAIADGNTTAIIIGGASGDPATDKRIQSFIDEFGAKGGTVQGITRCSSDSAAQTCAGNLMSAFPDAGCVYSVSGAYASGIAAAIQDKGLTSMKVYCSQINDTTLSLIEEGKVTAGCGGDMLVSAIGAILLENYLDDKKITDSSLKAPMVELDAYLIDSGNVAAYREKFINAKAISQTDVESLTYRYSQSVKYLSFFDAVSSIYANITAVSPSPSPSAAS